MSNTSYTTDFLKNVHMNTIQINGINKPAFTPGKTDIQIGFYSKTGSVQPIDDVGGCTNGLNLILSYEGNPNIHESKENRYNFVMKLSWHDKDGEEKNLGKDYYRNPEWKYFGKNIPLKSNPCRWEDGLRLFHSDYPDSTKQTMGVSAYPVKSSIKQEEEKEIQRINGLLNDALAKVEEKYADQIKNIQTTMTKLSHTKL